ncbi:MAG TPA: hypothetical protein VIB60_06995 [Methylomirabilota bacterium]
MDPPERPGSLDAGDAGVDGALLGGAAGVEAVADPALGAAEAPPAAARPPLVPALASIDAVGDGAGEGAGDDDGDVDGDTAGGAAGALPVAAAVPRVPAEPADDAAGLEAPGFSRMPGGRDGGAFSAVLHGARRNRLRGRSLPNHPAIHGPTRSASTSATPTPRHTRNHRALKMLGWRRTRCDTSDLMRLILEFPKYDRILAGQC